MGTGLSSKFNILQRSPHDLNPSQPELDIVSPSTSRWVPSRYTIRATTADDRLILWNTLTGSMSVFSEAQVEQVKELLGNSGIQSQPEGLVGYLIERGYLIKEGVSEYRRLQYAVGRQQHRSDILQFILLASEDCNFRCQYCYENFARGTMQPWVRTGIKRLVEKRLPLLKQLRATWFGGEPLYGLEAIEDLAPFFAEVSQKNSLSYSSDMTTNGYLLTPEVADKLLAWKVLYYQITIDGPPEYHNCSRPNREGQGTFDRIFENLRALHDRPEFFHVTMRVNFDQNNHAHLAPFFDLIQRELGDDKRFELRFRAVGKWGGPRDQDLSVCGEDDGQKIQHQLEDEARRQGLNVEGGIKQFNWLGGQVCYAARPYNFIVGASGKLMKCTVALDTKDYNVVGHIDENGELALDQDKMALWTEPAFENDTKCKKCVVLPICQGTHCPIIRIEQDKSPCTPLRANLKREMLTTHQLSGGQLKKKQVQPA